MIQFAYSFKNIYTRIKRGRFSCSSYFSSLVGCLVMLLPYLRRYINEQANTFFILVKKHCQSACATMLAKNEPTRITNDENVGNPFSTQLCGSHCRLLYEYKEQRT